MKKRIEFLLGALLIACLLTVATSERSDARIKWPNFVVIGGWLMLDPEWF